MAHINKVMKSVNSPDGSHCVDIFVRPDGSFGFEEYRRDVEDPGGWFPIGHHATMTFQTEHAARQAAGRRVCWLSSLPDRPTRST